MALEDEERPYTAIPTTKFSDVQAIQSDYTSGMISYPHRGVISSTANYSHLLFISAPMAMARGSSRYAFCKSYYPLLRHQNQCPPAPLKNCRVLLRNYINIKRCMIVPLVYILHVSSADASAILFTRTRWSTSNVSSKAMWDHTAPPSWRHIFN